MTPKGYLLPEFDSGATGLTGRFNGGFLLRRLQAAHGWLPFWMARLDEHAETIKAALPELAHKPSASPEEIES
jgi:hypothetical protein